MPAGRENLDPAGRTLIYPFKLFGFLDFIRSVRVKINFSFQVIDLFKFRSHILEHVKGFAASGTGRTDEDNRLVGGKRIYFFLKLIDGNVDGRFKVAGGKLIRVPDIHQINALGIFF